MHYHAWNCIYKRGERDPYEPSWIGFTRRFVSVECSPLSLTLWGRALGESSTSYYSYTRAVYIYIYIWCWPWWLVLLQKKPITKHVHGWTWWGGTQKLTFRASLFMLKAGSGIHPLWVGSVHSHLGWERGPPYTTFFWGIDNAWRPMPRQIPPSSILIQCNRLIQLRKRNV